MIYWVCICSFCCICVWMCGCGNETGSVDPYLQLILCAPVSVCVYELVWVCACACVRAWRQLSQTVQADKRLCWLQMRWSVYWHRKHQRHVLRHISPHCCTEFQALQCCFLLRWLICLGTEVPNLSNVISESSVLMCPSAVSSSSTNVCLLFRDFFLCHS